MPNRVALLRAEIQAAHPGARIRQRSECGFSMRLPGRREEHRYTTGPWHWRGPDDAGWREIDTDLEARNDPKWSHGVRSARFDTLIAGDGSRLLIPRRWLPGEYVEFSPPQQWAPAGWDTPALAAGELRGEGGLRGAGNRLVWGGAAHAYEVGFSGVGCRTNLTLKSAAVARPLRWKITLHGLDWKNGALISQSDGAEVGFIRPPHWTDTSDRLTAHPIEAGLEDGYWTLTPDLRDAVFPVTIDPDYSIAAGADDGHAHFSALGATPVCAAWYSADVVCYTGTTSTGAGQALLFFGRFDGIAADKDAQAAAATIAFRSTAAGSGSGLIDGLVYLVDDQDDYTMPANADGAETDYVARTAAYASNFDWDATAANQVGTTPDFSTACEERFSSAGWASGQAIGVMVGPAVADADNYQAVASYENTSYTEPILSLTIAVPAAGGGWGPIII